MIETSIAPRQRAAPKVRPKEAAARKRHLPPENVDKRAHILAAAQRVFEVKGLDGANMRAIAREAGYTPGAIYFYYKSQEEIYADLLSTSLRRLHDATKDAGNAAGSVPELAVERALAFYDYYATRPDELSLGFYLFKGIGPHGLTHALNERLNAELWSALAAVYQPLAEAGKHLDEALRDLTACFAYGVGLLLLVHTGRIPMFRQDGREMFRAFLQRTVGRDAPTDAGC